MVREPTLTTEVVVYNIESALNAQKGGADRVELCDNAGGGGTTPSLGTIEVLREALDIICHDSSKGRRFLLFLSIKL